MDNNGTRTSPKLTVLVILGVVAALHLAKGVLIPIALAGLIALLLKPLVQRIERLGVGPRSSVVIATTCACLVTCGFAWVLVRQVADFVQNIPEYRTNIVAKTESLGVVGKSIEKTFTAIQDLERQVIVTATESSGGRVEPEPLKVKTVEPTISPSRMLYQLTLAWAEPLAVAAMVFVLVVFFLVYRRDIGDRIVHLFGSGSVNVTSQAISAAAENVSRYLVLQSLVNATYGLTIAAALFGLGLPNALLLGLLAAVLRYIPYVGPVLGMVVPLLLSLAVFPGWTQPLVLLAFWIILELLTANLVEPLVYGRKASLSPIGVLVGTLFWTWLWGPAGLVLAVPMTVSVFVLGRNIPQLAFLDTLFGLDAALDPSAQLYRRLLAKDFDAAVALVDDYAKERTLVQVCDTLLVPALAIAERERHRETLAEERATSLRDDMRGLVEILEESGSPTAAPGDVASRPRPGPASILLIPASDDADEVVAVMLQACLSRVGCRSEVLPADATPDMKARRASETGTEAVCISSLPPNAAAPTRHLYQRVRTERADARVVIGAWATGDGLVAFQERAARDGKAQFVATLADAVELIRGMAPAPGVVAGRTPVRRRASKLSPPATESVEEAHATGGE